MQDPKLFPAVMLDVADDTRRAGRVGTVSHEWQEERQERVPKTRKKLKISPVIIGDLSHFLMV